MKQRCDWAGSDALYVNYHDTEWGVPLYDDRMLFEFLVLDGMQAGLSWMTILRKRGNFRRAFDNFDAERIARYRRARVEKLMGDTGIIRNRLKIEAAIGNAQAYLALKKEGGSFSEFLWNFVDGKPMINNWKTMKEIPAETTESRAMSKELKRRGFRFVGPTICYAFMQAAGMVNDHLTSCFRHREIQRLAGKIG